MKQPTLIILISIIFILFHFDVKSQDEIIVLTLRVSDAVANSQEARDLLTQFESENPGVQVEMISSMNQIILPPNSIDDVSIYLSHVENAVNSADVVNVNSSWLLPEATVGGYFLDLKPLVQQDVDFDPDAFVPQSWETVDWNGGIWAIPVTYDLTALWYDQTAFDEAGLAYPDATWTWGQIETTMAVLSETDTWLQLNVTNANGLIILRNFVDEPLVDRASILAKPNFRHPSLPDSITTLARMSDNGHVVLPGESNFSLDAPMLVTTISTAVLLQNRNLLPVIFPEGIAVKIDGFAISSGTRYPFEAYQLTKFLSLHPQFASVSGAGPVRQDIPLSSREQALNEFAEPMLPFAAPWPEFHYTNYIAQVVNATKDGIAPAQALEEVEGEIIARLDAIANNADLLEISIDSPPPRLALSDQITLNFAVSTLISPMPTQSIWVRFAETFAEENPNVARVNLTFSFPAISLEELNQIDCFYSTTLDLNQTNLNLLRDIGPLLQSDPTYDPDDFIANVDSQFVRANRTWGLPITLEPYTMWINKRMLDDVAAPYPEGTWRVDDFALVLDALGSSEVWGDEEVVVIYGDTSRRYLHMMIATYGGLPIDTSGQLIEIDFTSPSNVNAIRQVLDLAIEGQLQYLSGSEFGAGITPIIIARLDSANVRNGNLVLLSTNFGHGISGSEYTLIPFPYGDYTPVSFAIGATYITANSQYPEECYRFISAIADDPTLFASMPARWSMLDDPRLQSTRSNQDLAFYREIAQTMASNDIVQFPISPALELHFIQLWLESAFDAYVLEGADLEVELALAEDKARLFLLCIDEQDVTDEDFRSSIVDCVIAVDPENSIIEPPPFRD